jgi:hypothetical protein
MEDIPMLSEAHNTPQSASRGPDSLHPYQVAKAAIHTFLAFPRLSKRDRAAFYLYN